MILSVNNVSVGNGQNKKDDRLLIDNVSCTVRRGEILCIIGPNGAGKSTLISAITGDVDYRGEVLINGQVQNSKPEILARQMSVLPQLSLLNFPFRAFEVVNLARIPHRTGIKRDAQIVEAALELMGIAALKNRLYTELSGGERQRVQLARVLAQIWSADDSPNGERLLILDEPTSALDLGHQQDLMRAIGQFAKQGVAVVIVLHDINLAARYADKLLALLGSRTLAYGGVDEVITKDNIRCLFGIEPHIIQHPVHNTPVVLGL